MWDTGSTNVKQGWTTEDAVEKWCEEGGQLSVCL